MIGEITGYEIGKNKDGDSNVLKLQVRLTDADDVQTVQMFSQAGEDTNPATGSEVIVIPITKSWKIGIASDDGITPSMNPGEKKIYSVSSGAISAFINLLASGVVEINGNSDFAVRFNELKSGFDQLKSDFNTFVTMYNAHTHLDPVSGSTSTPSVTGASSSASIDASKVDEVKLP